MNDNTTAKPSLDLERATIATLLLERDGHTKALDAITGELTRRAKELESAIGKVKRTRKPRVAKGEQAAKAPKP